MHLINLHQSLQTKIYQDLLNSETIQGMDYTSFITNTNETTSLILLKELYRISSIKQKKLKNIQLENVEKLFLGIVNQMDKWSTNDIIELLSDSNKNKSDFQNSLYLKTIIYLCDKYPEIIRFNINTISTKVSGLLHSFKKNIFTLLFQM